MNAYTDAGESSPIRAIHESDGDDMMRGHLPMIFPSLFDIQYKKLSKPECRLAQIVKLDGGGDVRERIVGPEFAAVCPEWRGYPKVDSNTLHYTVVCESPSLLCKSGLVSGLFDASPKSKWLKNPIHQSDAQECEEE